MELLRSKISDYLASHVDYIINNVLVSVSNNKLLFPGGHNGPYMHPETPIRNTCHMIVLLNNLIVSNSLNDRKYSVVLNELYYYLVSNNGYEVNGQFIHRGLGNDTANGVIGDAWLIEALTVEEKLLTQENIVLRDALLHRIESRLKFDDHYQYCYRYDAMKGHISADFTFNHQLWLASAINNASLSISKKFTQGFLASASSGTLVCRDSGLINHLYHGASIKNRYNLFRYIFSFKKNKSKVLYKERGYHLFNLFAFAKMYNQCAESDIFKGEDFLRSISFVDFDFLNKLVGENNYYGLHYNAVAFELPYIYKKFEQFFSTSVNSDDMVGFMLEQLETVWDETRSCFYCDEVDELTFMARSYELSYYLV